MVADKVVENLPSADDTLTSLIEINKAMEKAMSLGQTELTFNATGVGEPELRRIGDNLTTFWGQPVRYSINSEFKDLEGIVPGRAVDVKNITNSFELSNNYYVYDYIRNGKVIPGEKTHAMELALALMEIAPVIFTDPEATDYEKALAAHDWLVANIDYDEKTPEKSDGNGSYGALIQRRTMCLGYAEAFELLLRCYTDVEVVQIVGEALNYRNENLVDVETDGDDGAGDDSGDDGTAESGADGDGGGEANGDSGDGDGDSGDGDGGAADEGDGDGADEGDGAAYVWGGHAWNAVKLGGAWYQVDTTFDDPRGNPTDHTSHFYFGQSDEVMSRNHRWEADYFPKSTAGDFLYFRNSGLFMENWDAFQEKVTELLLENPVEILEIAVIDGAIDEDNIQFTYQVRYDLQEIWWSAQTWNDIHVHMIEFLYS